MYRLYACCKGPKTMLQSGLLHYSFCRLTDRDEIMAFRGSSQLCNYSTFCCKELNYKSLHLWLEAFHILIFLHRPRSIILRHAKLLRLRSTDYSSRATPPLKRKFVALTGDFTRVVNLPLFQGAYYVSWPRRTREACLITLETLQTSCCTEFHDPDVFSFFASSIASSTPGNDFDP